MVDHSLRHVFSAAKDAADVPPDGQRYVGTRGALAGLDTSYFCCIIPGFQMECIAYIEMLSRRVNLAFASFIAET